MTVQEAIEARHSVREYRDEPIPQDIRVQLDEFVEEVNRESGLDIKVVYDDPSGFDSRMAHYGKFSGVSNYIILKGTKTSDFDFAADISAKKWLSARSSWGSIPAGPR